MKFREGLILFFALGFVPIRTLAGDPVQAGEMTAEQIIKAFETGLQPLAPGPAEPNAPAPKVQTLAERMAFYKVPGVSLAVIRDGRIEWAGGYGEIIAGSGKAVTPDTLFEAASTTKALVAAAVLHPGNNFPGSVCWLIGFPERRMGAIMMLNGNNGELPAFEILAALGRIYDWPPLM